MSYTITRRLSLAGDNRLDAKDRAVHDWYRFVLAFPPHLVDGYLREFGLLDRGGRVLDPFCGTGTTLVEAKKQGVSSVGIEANPLAEFAARVKTDWRPDPDGLRAYALHIEQSALAELRAQGIEDEQSEAGTPTQNLAGLLTLPNKELGLLLTNSISELPLHKALVLLRVMDTERDPAYDAHARLAFAKSIVASSSNLHFGPEVGVGPKRPDAPVVGPWRSGVEAMANDLVELQGRSAVSVDVYPGDAREMDVPIEHESISAVITSPPYPNEKDYTRTTRLESVLLGLLTTRDDLRLLKLGLVRSNTRNVYADDIDDYWVAQHPVVMRIAREIDERRIELEKTSGFEKLYGRVTRLYFGGMHRHLEALKPSLRPEARLAYVVGDQASYFRIMIPTGELLASIAEDLGYRVLGREQFRTRLATATGEQLVEEVVVLEWPGNAVHATNGVVHARPTTLSQRQTAIVEALFNNRWDETNARLRNSLVTIADLSMAIQASNEAHPGEAALSARNPANFFKDFVRRPERANRLWPKSVLERGYTAARDLNGRAIFEFLPLAPGQIEPFPTRSE